MMAWCLTTLVIGVVLWFLWRPEAPVHIVIKYLLTFVGCMFILLFGLQVFFGYHFPGVK